MVSIQKKWKKGITNRQLRKSNLSGEISLGGSSSGFYSWASWSGSYSEPNNEALYQNPDLGPVGKDPSDLLLKWNAPQMITTYNYSAVPPPSDVEETQCRMSVFNLYADNSNSGN